MHKPYLKKRNIKLGVRRCPNLRQSKRIQRFQFAQTSDSVWESTSIANMFVSEIFQTHKEPCTNNKPNYDITTQLASEEITTSFPNLSRIL